MRRRLSRRLVPALAGVLVLALTACQPDADDDPPPGPVQLELGVFGSEEEVAAFQEVVDTYNAEAVATEVELVSWPDSYSFSLAVQADDVPDIFLTARRDLAAVVEGGHNAPLFDLLEAREVSYGDAYSQPAIEAFSSDDDLQCMPYSVSPMVIYYNTDLIDFEAMRERGLPAPDDELEGWTFEEFRAAAAFASRGREPGRGIGLEPRLRSIAPFVYSGGGQLFDDEAGSPTSLALASGENVDTLTTLMGVLRDPALTLTPDQLAEAPPRTWFERGELAMIEGFRDLTPELREVEGLNFDVMPMPTVGAPATIGDITGLCIAPGEHVQQAADFLVYAIADESVATVAEAGHVVPANLVVARSEAFLQSDRQPEHAGVFNASLSSLVLPPVVEEGPELDEAVRPLLDDMFNAPTLLDLPSLLAEIDETSRSVLDPDYEPTPSESPS